MHIDIIPSVNEIMAYQKCSKYAPFGETIHWKKIEAKGVNNANPTFLNPLERYFCCSVIMARRIYHFEVKNHVAVGYISQS